MISHSTTQRLSEHELRARHLHSLHAVRTPMLDLFIAHILGRRLHIMLLPSFRAPCWPCLWPYGCSLVSGADAQVLWTCRLHIWHGAPHCSGRLSFLLGWLEIHSGRV